MQWLQRRGFEAYLVGGCVRDLLLGLLPKDFDIATSARPAQVKRVFPRNCRIIGRRFKLAHLHFHHNSKILECSTFRRTPSEDRTGDDLLITQDNEFGSAEEDALRRDFPINALFFDPMQDRILDWTGGLEDLRAGVIRTIGDPVVRFREDPIRILRAAKFAGRLGFQIDPASLDAMAQTAPDLVRAAPPRVLEEILRLLRCGNALDCFQVLRDIGAIKVLLPIVGDFLSNAGEAERVVFWHLLDALDGKVRSGRVPSNPVLLGTLFARPVAEACAREPDRAPATIAERLLGPFANTLRLPRRDSGCLKRICGVLGRFRSQSNRRFKTTAFLRDPYFYEALDLFELHCIATGEGAEELEQWRRLSDESSGEVPEGFQDDRDDGGDGDGGDGSDSEPASEPEDEPRPQLREPNDDPEAALSAPQPDPEHAWDEPARTQAQPSLESESDLRGGRRRRRGRRGRRDDTMARGDSRTPLSGDGDSAEAREDGRELGTGPETRPAGDPHLEETDEREGDREGRTSTQSAAQGATQGAGEGRATREVAEPEDEDHDATEPAPTASDLLIPESEFRKLSRSARRRRLRKLRRMRQEGGDARPESGRSESSRPAFAGESSDSGRREEPTPELPAADEQAHDLRGAESPGDLGSGDLSSGDLRSGDVSSLEDAGGRRKRRRRRRGRRGDGERADIEPGTEELTPQPPSSESEVPEPSEEEIAKAAAPTEFSDEPEPLAPLEDVGDIEVPPFEEPPSEPDPQRGQHGRHPRQKQAHARGRGGDRGRDPRSIHPREQHPREQHPREQHPREQHPREQRSRDQRARDQGQRREGHPRQQPQGPQNPQTPQQPQRPGGPPARREDKKHGSRRDRNRDRGKPDGRHPGKPPHDRRGGKVEVLEPESVDLTAFEVELDPTRAPTFGAGVESQQRKKSPIRKILLEEDKEPYKPPPPPDLDPNAAPPAPTEGPESGGGDTFGDW